MQVCLYDMFSENFILNLQLLMEAGVDSLAVVELASSVSAHFGLDVPATLTFDYPTISAMAAFLAPQTSLAQNSVAVVEPRSTMLLSGNSRRGDSGSGMSSIIGVACRYPGGAAPAAHLQNLCLRACRSVQVILSFSFSYWEWKSLAGNVEVTDCAEAHARQLRPVGFFSCASMGMEGCVWCDSRVQCRGRLNLWSERVPGDNVGRQGCAAGGAGSSLGHGRCLQPRHCPWQDVHQRQVGLQEHPLIARNCLNCLFLFQK